MLFIVYPKDLVALAKTLYSPTNMFNVRSLIYLLFCESWISKQSQHNLMNIPRYLYIGGWRTTLGFIVTNVVGIYPLVVSYCPRYHIRINRHYWHVVIIPKHIMLLSHFLVHDLNDFCKLLIAIVIYYENQTKSP